MSITASVVKQIVLTLIGGSPITPVPTTTIMGSPAVSQLSIGTLASLASSAAQIASSVATLSAVVKNPVGPVSEDILSKVGNLTSNNFSQLDTTLGGAGGVSTDPALDASYKKLKTALGGGDGTAGINSKISKFKEHTDRVSGVKLSNDSTLSKPLTVPQTPGGR